jgi:hypothetical protein
VANYPSSCTSTNSVSSFKALPSMFGYSVTTKLPLVCRVNHLQSCHSWPGRIPKWHSGWLVHSWDILQAIGALMRRQPTTTITHVKGHQDSNTSPTQDQPLPPEEVTLLNIWADGLDGSYQSQSHHKYQQVPTIAGTKCQLNLHGRTLVSKFKLRLQISTSVKIQMEAPNPPIHLYQSSPRLVPFWVVCMVLWWILFNGLLACTSPSHLKLDH